MSSKQAELRRLMKLQRERKEMQEQVARTLAQQPKKGILRTKAAPTTVGNDKAAAFLPKRNESEGLSSLLTAYDSDSSEESQSQSMDKPSAIETTSIDTSSSRGRVSWPTDETQLETTHLIPERPKPYKGMFIETKPALNDKLVLRSGGPLAQEPGNVGGKDARVTRAATVTTSADTSDNTLESGRAEHEALDIEWQSFVDLIGQDDDTSDSDVWSDRNEGAVTNESKSLQNAAPIEEERAPRATEGAARIDTSDETDASTTVELEQASYEARIAMLRLRASTRLRRTKEAASSSDADLGRFSISVYTPELAFGQEKETTDTERKADSHSFAMEMLRRKRARARQLEGDDDAV